MLLLPRRNPSIVLVGVGLLVVSSYPALGFAVPQQKTQDYRLPTSAATSAATSGRPFVPAGTKRSSSRLFSSPDENGSIIAALRNENRTLRNRVTELENFVEETAVKSQRLVAARTAASTSDDATAREPATAALILPQQPSSASAPPPIAPSSAPYPPEATALWTTIDKTPQTETNGPPPLSNARRSLPSGYTLQKIEGKGFGIVTHQAIPKNTVVGDYTGEILTEDQKNRRYLESRASMRTMEDTAWIESRRERGQGLTGTYVYGVTMPDGRPPVYVDSEDEDVGGWTRFLNHDSSRENCNLLPKSIHESYDGRPRVWFVTTRDVGVGEELCFDYGDDYWLEGDEVR